MVLPRKAAMVSSRRRLTALLRVSPRKRSISRGPVELVAELVPVRVVSVKVASREEAVVNVVADVAEDPVARAMRTLTLPWT